MDFSPKDYSEKFKNIAQLKETIEDLSTIDFSDCASSFIKEIVYMADQLEEDPGISDYADRNASDIAKNIEKELSEIKTAKSSISNIESDFFNTIEEDFSDKLRFYTEFAENNLVEEEFPFGEWIKIGQEITNKYHFSSWEVYDQIQRIIQVNKEIANLNIAEHLSSLLNFKKIDDVLFRGHEFFEKNLPGKYVNVLSGKGYGDYLKALNGEDIEVSNESTLLFKYAASLLTKKWKFKEEEINGKIIKKESNDWAEIFEYFSKTEVCNKINKSLDFQKKFIDALLDYEDGTNIIYNVSYLYKNQKNPQVNKVNWDIAKNLVIYVLKDSLEATDYFVTKMAKDYKKEDNETNIKLTELMNLALHSKLQKEVSSKNEIKEKKAKI